MVVVAATNKSHFHETAPRLFIKPSPHNISCFQSNPKIMTFDYKHGRRRHLKNFLWTFTKLDTIEIISNSMLLNLNCRIKKDQGWKQAKEPGESQRQQLGCNIIFQCLTYLDQPKSGDSTTKKEIVRRADLTAKREETKIRSRVQGPSTKVKDGQRRHWLQANAGRKAKTFL